MGLIEKTATTRPTALVLGMLPSGAPGLAATLAALLSDSAGPAIPARASRRKGFLELAKTAALHRLILSSAGAPRDDWQPLDPAWFTSARAKALRGMAQGLVSSDFAAAGPIAVEDPRLARFLPFWLPVLRAAGLRLPAVLIHRHPAALARALEEQRGLAPSLGLLQWLSFTLESEAATRGSARAFVAFEALADTPGRTGLAQVETLLGTRFDQLPATGGTTPAADMPAPLPAAVETVHAILSRWCAGGEDTRDHPRLDQARRLVFSLTSGHETTADAAQTMLQALGQPGDGAALPASRLNRMRKPELVRLAQALGAANAALAMPPPAADTAPVSPQDALARRDRELAAFARLLREAESAPAALRDRLDKANTDIARLRRRIEAQSAENDRLARDGHALHRKIAEDRRQAQADLAALRAENTELHQLVARVHHEREAVLNSRVWRATAPLRRLVSWLRAGRGG